MKKGKEFIFPENVDKDYGIWKDYTLKDFGYAALAGLVGLIFIAIPLIFMQPFAISAKRCHNTKGKRYH
jgi:hypothetical protein